MPRLQPRRPSEFARPRRAAILDRNSSTMGQGYHAVAFGPALGAAICSVGMRFVVTLLVLLTAGCKDEDLISTVPEPGPDGPVVDADTRCMPPEQCETAADCDDCDACTTDTCGTEGCEYAQIFPCGCCVIQDTPGCGNSAIEDCVCRGVLPMGEVCCDTAWDITCVEDVGQKCGGECGCCTPHSESGCYDDPVVAGAISDCVCAIDPGCCIRPPVGTGWDATCVSQVVDPCGGTCP